MSTMPSGKFFGYSRVYSSTTKGPTDTEATSLRPVRSRGATRPDAMACRTSEEHEAQLFRSEDLMRFVQKRDSANCKGSLGCRVRASTRNIGSLTIPSSTLKTVALNDLACDNLHHMVLPLYQGFGRYEHLDGPRSKTTDTPRQHVSLAPSHA